MGEAQGGAVAVEGGVPHNGVALVALFGGEEECGLKISEAHRRYMLNRIVVSGSLF